MPALCPQFISDFHSSYAPYLLDRCWPIIGGFPTVFLKFPCVSQADSYVPHSTLLLLYNVLEFEGKKRFFLVCLFVCLFFLIEKVKRGKMAVYNKALS